MQCASAQTGDMEEEEDAIYVAAAEPPLELFDAALG